MEFVGRIPTTPAEITASWLNDRLSETGARDLGRIERCDWQVIGEELGFTGVVARLHLTYTGDDSIQRGPASLIAKMPTAARSTPSSYRTNQRVNAAAIRRHYERCVRELRFYREIAPASQIPVPRLYGGAADDETGHVVLLLQDFPGAESGDVLRGCSSVDAAAVLESMAAFHARWWNRRDAAWLPPWGSDHLARQHRLEQQVGVFLERFGTDIPVELHRLIERLRSGLADVLDALDRAPTTVIHADLHLDNILFDRPDSDRAPVVLDWQTVSRGPAALDVASFLFGSLSVTDRRSAGDDVLHRYQARLIEFGVTGYSFEALRLDCRRALLRQWPAR